MPKTTGPLFSLSSRGSLAKTLVYSTWRGVNYARQHVIPANPRTSPQVATRNVFSWLSEFWRWMPAEFHSAWTLAAKGRPLTDRNLLVRDNMHTLRDGSDISLLVGSPGTGNAPAILLDAVGGTVGAITFIVDTLSVPPGWDYVAMHTLCLKDQDPHDPFEQPVVFSEVAAPSLTTTTDATELNGFLLRLVTMAEFTDDKGNTQFSPSLIASFDAT